MPLVYLGLGSNLGERRTHLRRALAALDQAGLDIRRVSPVVESPALLPRPAPSDWNLPFLNLVLEAQAHSPASAAQWRARCKRIEAQLNQHVGPSGAPREIDIDILLWGDQVIDSQAFAHNFVLSPLVALRPDLFIEGATALQRSNALDHHIPLWMGILNVTPDSFSDGGWFSDWPTVEAHIDSMLAAGVHIIDVGAESTRPGAHPIDASTEWRRLAPVLTKLFDKIDPGDPLRPQVSIDTYHPQTAARALEYPVDIINDVGGLTDPEMLAIARESVCDWIAMHHLTLPVERGVTLAADKDTGTEVEAWLQRRLEVWQAGGLELRRIVFDPGIGFGKDGLQSLELLRQAKRFRQYGLRLLIGHSRKSFMAQLSGRSLMERDLATVGASLALCQQGVDIIRVHNVPLHVAAYRGWAHLQDCPR